MSSEIQFNYKNERNYEVVLRYLNNLDGIKGFFYENYSPTGTLNKEYQRFYFTDENTMKFDSVRLKIEEWKNKNLLTENEYFILLATLMECMDKVSNTTSVYAAFLKNFKKSALKPLLLTPLTLNYNGKNHQVFMEDASILIKSINADIVYLDPPYNTRQYAQNYHILETMALYDNPILYGKTGTRTYEHQKSDFSSKIKVKTAFRNLIHNISNTKTKYIILSYNNEGIMSKEYILSVLQEYGEVIVEEINYKRYKSDINSEKRQYKNTNNVIEYVYILKRKTL